MLSKFLRSLSLFLAILGCLVTASPADEAGDWYTKAETAVCEATDAVNGLSPRPWLPQYTMYRDIAIATLSGANRSLTDASAWLSEMQYWDKKAKIARNAGDFATAASCSAQYWNAVEQCIECSYGAKQQADGAKACVRQALSFVR